MNTKYVRLLATSLLLALILVSVFFVSASPQAHAAQLKPVVEKSSTLPMDEGQANSARTAMSNCKPAGTVYTESWGIRLHVYSCGVQLLASGASIVALFPGSTIPGGIAAAVVTGASALSCDGSVNIDYEWGVVTGLQLPTVRPGC